MIEHLIVGCQCSGKKCPVCTFLLCERAFSPLKKGGYYAYCKDCQNKRNRLAYKEKGKSDIKRQREQAQNWYRRFSFTQEQYFTLLEAQKGLCAACGLPETMLDKRSKKVRMLALDHDHDTGKIRGLLCTACNISLGLLKDDPKRIKALLQYIEERC